jgi:hypothetical protein
MGIRGIIRFPSTLMISARQHLHARMKHTHITECHFGLCNAPTSFQRCMIEEIMEVFMDDFLVYGKTFDHYLENLDKVL